MVEANSLALRTSLRLFAGFAVAPPAAVLLALATYNLLWHLGLLSGGAPIDSIYAATPLGIGVGVIAVVMTFAAVPPIAWLASRGPVSFGKVILLGAALGNLPFALIVLGVVAAHPFREILSGDIGRFWYGVSGAAQRVAIGLASGMGAASLFWIVGIRGTAVQRGDHRFSLRHG